MNVYYQRKSIDSVYRQINPINVINRELTKHKKDCLR